MQCMRVHRFVFVDFFSCGHQEELKATTMTIKRGFLKGKKTDSLVHAIIYINIICVHR